MKLRPYQQEFVEDVLRDLIERNRVLAVAPTGSGKTIMAAEIIRRTVPFGRALFLADAQELVKQTAQKLMDYSGCSAAVEMADSKAMPGDQVVVATTQSIARRLEKWPQDYFAIIVVDEAHRNTLGTMSQSVLSHFSSAQIVGITATPFRSDKKQLGTFYENISHEIFLPKLIRDGYLARITVKSVPLPVDLRAVKTVAGDYSESDLGSAIAPHLGAAAAMLAEHAKGRKTVAFLPLIQTSIDFAAACNDAGLRAIHASGVDRDGIAQFAAGEYDVISNAALLTTGWDCPPVDCVFILRPTRSLVLYQQMVGRGTRIHPGKSDLLILDPLYLSDDHKLITPVRLVAKNDAEIESIQSRLDMGPGGKDLLEADDEATADRHAAILRRMKEVRRNKSRTIDAIELALSLDESDLVDYDPICEWERAPVSDKQAEILTRMGVAPETCSCKGHASRLLDTLFRRRSVGLATPKQMRWLHKFRHHSPHTATFEEATKFLDSRFTKRAQ